MGVLIQGFLLYNFLYAEFGPTEVSRVIHILKPQRSVGRRDEKRILNLMNISLQMNPGARTATTTVYFKANGITNKNLLAALDFDFYPFFEDGGEFQPLFERMVGLAP